jgi:hypothetical protein
MNVPQPPPAATQIDAWQCIGCGRVDAPRPCIGVCQDRRVALVQASDYAQLEQRFADLARQAVAMRAFLGLLAHVQPTPEGWEASFRAMQEKARAVLEMG